MIGIVCAFFHTEGKGFYSIAACMYNCSAIAMEQETRKAPLQYVVFEITVLFICLRIRLYSLKSLSVARYAYVF